MSHDATSAAQTQSAVYVQPKHGIATQTTRKPTKTTPMIGNSDAANGQIDALLQGYNGHRGSCDLSLHGRSFGRRSTPKVNAWGHGDKMIKSNWIYWSSL